MSDINRTKRAWQSKAAKINSNTSVRRVSANEELARLHEEGKRRFGSPCRHESVYFGHCSYCGRKVVIV